MSTNLVHALVPERYGIYTCSVNPTGNLKKMKLALVRHTGLQSLDQFVALGHLFLIMIALLIYSPTSPSHAKRKELHKNLLTNATSRACQVNMLG